MKYTEIMKEKLEKLPSDIIFREIYDIRNDLVFLDDTVSLTKVQRKAFNDIIRRINFLLDYNHGRV